MGFRNLDTTIARSLLHAGGFRHAIQTRLWHMPLHAKIGKAGNTTTRRLLYVQLLYMGLFIMNCCVYNNVG